MLANENLQELPILLNFEMDSLDPAVFILCGQSHLRERFLRPVHESLQQRIRIRYHLLPLGREELPAYVAHHLARCGRKDSPFTDAALDAIFQNTVGNPRKINHLASKTLMLGALDKKKTLSEEEVFKASREL